MLIAAQPLPADIEVIEEAQVVLVEVRHILHLLEIGIDADFEFDRAVARNGDTLTFNFAQDGIDATQWLLSEAWKRSADLQERLLAHLNARQAGKRRAA
jgi:hypothetical protein